jgi:hypothetical protein
MGRTIVRDAIVMSTVPSIGGLPENNSLIEGSTAVATVRNHGAAAISDARHDAAVACDAWSR